MDSALSFLKDDDTNADVNLPILTKDDPKVMPDETTQAKRGYSSTIIIIS